MWVIQADTWSLDFSSHGPRASLEDGWQLTVTDFPWDVFNHVCPCDMCGCTLLT